MRNKCPGAGGVRRVITPQNAVSAAAVIISPIISFILFEYVTGNLGTIMPYRALLNIGWYYVFYLAAMAVFGTTRITVPVMSGFFYVLSLAETYVEAFRARPIMLWDIFALRTAATVAGAYQYFFSVAMAVSLVLLIVVNVLAWRFPIRFGTIRARLIGLVGIVGISACYVLWFFTYYIPVNNAGVNTWDPNLTYSVSGYMYSTAVSLRYVIKDPPEGYSIAAVMEIYERLTAESDDPAVYEVPEGTAAPATEGTANDVARPAGEVIPVNIICIMNESLAELKTGGDFTTNIEYFPYINSLKDNTVKGSLCVSIFGSMTSCTEFEFLTGDSMTMLTYNTSPYQFNVKPGSMTLVSTLKDQGYRAVAMHPYPGANWNRDTVYGYMGFDEFLDIDDFEDAELLREYVSDKSDYDKIIETVEAKESPEERLFIFNVTMQNHGGYDLLYDNFEQEVWLTGELEGLYPKTDQFLSLMKYSDDAFRYLTQYFENCDEPTMIVLFGDHQPSVEDEFFDAIAGMSSAEVAAGDRLMWYETPFVIWTNYEMPSEDLGRLSSIFLSSEMLSRTGLKMTPYNRFLLSMDRDLSVVHWYGLCDSQGGFYSWDQIESSVHPYYGLMKEYEYLVYNHSYDRKKVEALFQIEQD